MPLTWKHCQFGKIKANKAMINARLFLFQGKWFYPIEFLASNSNNNLGIEMMGAVCERLFFSFIISKTFSDIVVLIKTATTKRRSFWKNLNPTRYLSVYMIYIFDSFGMHLCNFCEVNFIEFLFYISAFPSIMLM